MLTSKSIFQIKFLFISMKVSEKIFQFHSLSTFSFGFQGFNISTKEINKSTKIYTQTKMYNVFCEI